MTASRKGLSVAAVEYALFPIGVVDVRIGYRVLKVAGTGFDVRVDAEGPPLYVGARPRIDEA